MKDVGHWVRLTARALLAVFGAAVGVVNVLAERNIWKISVGYQVTIIVTLAGVTFLDNIRQAVHRFLAPGREEAKVRTQKALIGVLLAIANEKSLEVAHLGSSIFVLRRGGVFRRKRLVRRVRFRLANHPQATEVDWKKGKGAVGTCWSTGRTTYRYRRPVAAKYGSRNLDGSDFAELKEGVTSGFTHEEFQSMICKYAEILAVPIKSEQGEFMGVVSIDLSIDAPSGAKYLEDSAVERLVVEGAVGLLREDVDRL